MTASHVNATVRHVNATVRRVDATLRHATIQSMDSPAADYLFDEKYKVLETLGSGGMGRVFKAFDTTLERVVAIKLLHPHLLSSESSRKRFVREARSMEGVHHPCIAEIYQVSTLQTGEIYLVCEFIDGLSLKERIARDGALSEADVSGVFADVLLGLAAAHERDIVHRDMTPANIMLVAGNKVKIIDFGLAKSLVGDQQQLTREGAVLGTPAYMSPEQLTGGSVDARSDIFSVGCAMYEALSGRPPWDAAALSDLSARLHKPPNGLPASVSERMRAIVMHALAPEAQNRFQTAREMHDCLTGTAPIRMAVSSVAKRPGSFVKKLNGWQWGAVGLLILAVVAAASVGLQSALRKSAHVRLTQALGEVQRAASMRNDLACTAAARLALDQIEIAEASPAEIDRTIGALLTASSLDRVHQTELCDAAEKLARKYKTVLPAEAYATSMLTLSGALERDERTERETSVLREAGTGLFSSRANVFSERNYEQFDSHVGRLFDEHSRDPAILSKRVEFLNSIGASNADEKVLTRLRTLKVESLGLLVNSISPANCEERLKIYAQIIAFSKEKPELPGLSAYEIAAGGTLRNAQRERESIPYLESGLQRQWNAHIAVNAIMLEAELWLGDAYLHTGDTASAQRIYELVEKQTEDKPQFLIFCSKSFSRRAVVQQSTDFPMALALMEKSYDVLTKSGAGRGAKMSSAQEKELLEYKTSLLSEKEKLTIKVAKSKAKKQSQTELRRRELDAR